MAKSRNASTSKANAVQVGGDHYQRGAGCCPHCGQPIQHWDLVTAFGLDYFVGNATKYLFRLGLKGEAAEQVEKAIHYLQKKLELLRRPRQPRR